jgi:FlaA1/EpsC-like NDP-sugar epimerase
MAIVVGMGKHLPRSYYVIRTFYLIALVGGSRFFYRLIRLRYRKRQHYSIKKKKKIMLIGAGEAGRTLIQEIQNSRYLDQKICCVIDDNRRKIGRYILGIRVVGDRNAIKRSVEHYGIEQIIIAIPSAGSRKIRPILEICKDTGCELKILPGVYQLVNGEVNVSKLRPVNIEDLLGREEINVNIDEIMDYVCSKTILVTGGGGSIGSELCRQIAAHKPERLIIFDIYENNAYDIQQELKMKYPNLKLTVLIGSIRDEERVDTVLGKYRPDIIYHAAAHKHVPLMEASPNEAIKNNVLGTYNLVLAAGGPVTVTDPEIIRYFMTISEAVSLVLQAGVYARGGEIFVLDMGEPVKILDLAKNMIRLSGYIPEKDIAIEFTGLRPGEKLYEELLMDEEGMTETPNKLIHIGHPIDVDEDRLYYALRVMKEAAANETDDMRLLMQSIVSTYHIKTEENQQCENLQKAI